MSCFLLMLASIIGGVDYDLGQIAVVNTPVEAQEKTEPVRKRTRKALRGFDELGERVRSHLPRFKEASDREAMSDPDAVHYDKRLIAPAYSHNGVMHSPSYNISMAKPDEPYGNGNIEFPWGKPMGTDNCTNVYTTNALVLPRKNGKLRPVAVTSTDTWTFPPGTRLVECLFQKSPDGHDVLWAFNEQQKLPNGFWTPAVISPIPGDPKEAKRYLADYGVLLKYRKAGKQSRANRHPNRIFESTAEVWYIQDFPDNEVVEVLKTVPWVRNYGTDWVPTSVKTFNLIPGGYQGYFTAVNEDREATNSCVSCHKSAGKSVNEFESSRDWYGSVRGSDGIFSFHPYDNSCISYSGFDQESFLNQDLLNAGIIAPYSPTEHSDYRQSP